MGYHLVSVRKMLPYFSVKEYVLGLVIMFILIITCMDLLRKIKFGRRYATNTPVVPYVPLIGSTYRFLVNDPMDSTLNLCKDYKSCYFWMFTEPYYITCDPDELQIILNHRYSIEKGSAYNVLRSVLHESIILSPEAVWRKTRKLITKIFKQKVFNTFVPLFNEVSDEYILTMEKEETTADLEKKNTQFFIETFTYNFLKYGTNEKLNKIRSEFNFGGAPKIIMDSVLCRMLNPLYYFDCIYKLTSAGIEYFRTSEQSLDFSTEIIHSRRQKRMDPGFSEEIDGLSLIDLLDDNDKNFQDIIGEILFISGAAGETSGKVLTYAMAVLGLYKDIQEKVYEEVTRVTENDGMIDSAALNNMKYTKMVLFETMRMFTPVPMILRQVTEDLELSWKYANMIGITILGKIVEKYKISSSLKSLEEIKLRSLVLLNIPKDIRVTFTPRDN